jgi:hypothetical protein
MKRCCKLTSISVFECVTSSRERIVSCYFVPWRASQAGTTAQQAGCIARRNAQSAPADRELSLQEGVVSL